MLTFRAWATCGHSSFLSVNQENNPSMSPGWASWTIFSVAWGQVFIRAHSLSLCPHLLSKLTFLFFADAASFFCLSYTLGQNKMEQQTPIPTKTRMKPREGQKRAIFWGGGGSRFSIYFVQDCRCLIASQAVRHAFLPHERVTNP